MQQPANNYVNRLPDEVLQDVFRKVVTVVNIVPTYYRPESMDLTICHVCKRWRALCLSLASLWSNIVIHLEEIGGEGWGEIPDNRHGRGQHAVPLLSRMDILCRDLLACLSLSKGHPLTVRVYSSFEIDSDLLPPIFRILGNEAHRWSSIILNGEATLAVVKEGKEPWAVQPRPMHFLQYLRFDDIRLCEQTLDTFATTSSDLSALTHLSLSGMNFNRTQSSGYNGGKRPSTQFPYRQITHLAIVHRDDDFFEMELTTAGPFLNQFQSLEYLIIWPISDNLGPLDVETPETPITLPQLRTLVIALDIHPRHRYSEKLLGPLKAPNLTSLKISSQGHRASFYNSPATTFSIPRFLNSSGCTLTELQLTGIDGPTSIAIFRSTPQLKILKLGSGEGLKEPDTLDRLVWNCCWDRNQGFEGRSSLTLACEHGAENLLPRLTKLYLRGFFNCQSSIMKMICSRFSQGEEGSKGNRSEDHLPSNLDFVEIVIEKRLQLSSDGYAGPTSEEKPCALDSIWKDLGVHGGFRIIETADKTFENPGSPYFPLYGWESVIW